MGGAARCPGTRLTTTPKTPVQQGGALVAALGDQTSHAAEHGPGHVDVRVLPPSETIAGATLWRAGDADGGAAVNATYQFWLAGPNDDGPTTLRRMRVANLNVVVWRRKSRAALVRPQIAWSYRLNNLGAHLYLNASCGGISRDSECQRRYGDANDYAAVVYLYAADMILEQSAGPSASNVSGELASAPAVSGTSDVAFSATDPGAGVYEAMFSVDGQVVQSTVPDENGGRCRNVGQTTDGLAAFLYLQPCPAKVSVDVPFDTTAVSNGAHHLIVSVIDAAGNAAPVLDREIDVDNPVPAGPTPATRRTARTPRARRR